ncbi:MAG: stalk domain-containing protein, partial [Oscillospiraceae bacterium]
MLTGMKNIPEDWKVETDGGYAKGELKESSQKPDIYSMKIDSRGGDVKLTKDFEVQDNKLIYKYKILIPKAIDGVKISLASGADNAISVTTNGSEFVSIDGGGNEKNIYKYVPNVWYHFKWEIDLNTNLATININGRKAIEDVPIASNGSIDNIKVLAKQNSITEIFLDDFLLTKKYDEPSDYVPEPKKVESENTLNGMQMCSLWRDGNHIGWDWINNTPERKPYMGYYDEGSPEVADWEIKWMLEHGINFQMYCWYNIVADSDQPLKDPAMGWAIHDGLFDAKYRDQMDYMILWENAPHKAKNTLEHFKNNLVPFWIEHYLKDENYLKVDNRPIFGIYEYGQFLNDVGGKEKAKEALEYFTNECNKAGVGEPFFITSSSGNNDEVAVGFDYIYQYTYQMGSWIPDKQKDSMISYSKKDPKLGVIPSICMGRDDSPWGMGPGNFVEPEKYKELISWVKEDLTPTLPKIASKPINMFTTWNEYGEGHFICPTEMTGFSYLDAIREAYIGDGEHQDIRPTKNQLDRIDNLYDSERKVKPLKRNPKPEKTPTNVVKGWYFDKDGDTEGWSANGIIKNYKALDGKISGEVTGWDPVLFSPSLGEFDASTVSQVKIRMKNGTSDCAGEFYYITKKYDGYTETKGINFEIVPNDNEFRDYYVDIYRSPYWREEDKVTQIRIDPTQWSESGKFEIESIELLGEPKEPDNSIGVFVDGDKKVCETKPFIVDGVTYAPLTNVGSYLSCETDWEEKTGTISAVRGDKTLQFKEGSNSVLINGNEIQIKQAPIVKDGTTYVSIRFIAETLGLDADWNDEENSILIRTPEYMKKEAEKEQPEKKRKL